jgi:integrase
MITLLQPKPGGWLLLIGPPSKSSTILSAIVQLTYKGPLHIIEGHPLEALFYQALTTSMRKGEILGLMWTDVDWEKSNLRVERQLQPVSFKTGALVPTKTKAGRRAILIGPQTVALLKEHREKQER